jgi:FkbM family methyltransferase
MADLKKPLRTLQNHFPGLRGLKNDFYYYTRRYLGLSHEADFAVIGALRQKPSDLFLDIGANRGQSILSIRKYRPDAPIIAFEPNPVIFAELDRRFGAMAGVSLRNHGLGPAAGSFTLFVPAYNGFVYDGVASFSRESAMGYFSPKTLYFYDPGRVSVSEHRCEVVTLDSLGLAPSFLKIDIEGYEFEMLKGAVETLKRHEPAILIEQFWESQEVRALLGGLGYETVAVRNGRLAVVPPGGGLNAVMMTPARLRAEL